uniref:Uncharacterized protein LOC111103413 n=1 Tax=Crassostrea virginica TaxID=6565 RepID=A0A8B8AQF5_CRAVI|nr:uncharacterized protein LOC111103413 [Crassostrea virginica]
MRFLKDICLIVLVIINTPGTKGLLGHGNPNSSDLTHSFPGHIVDMTEVMQILENHTQQIKNQTQQIESDRTTIQLLQNRVFFLEAEQNKLNASKSFSTQEFSTYLISMNQLIQNMVANEENDKNLTNHFNAAVKQLDDLHTAMKLLNGSLLQQLEERISHVHDNIIANVSTRIAFTAGVTSFSVTWSSGTLVFPKVITNVGSGYNPSDGVFTAPRAGVYVFFVNVQSYNRFSIYVDIVLNGATKVRTMANSYGGNDYFDAGPNLAVLSLQTGDRVWVKYYFGQGYYTYSDGPITTFSGFLI